jgi:hypothetical protein
MLTVKCHMPEYPRVSDDLCHWNCLQLDAMETQGKLFELQRTLSEQITLLLAALEQNTDAVRHFAAALRGMASG